MQMSFKFRYILLALMIYIGFSTSCTTKEKTYEDPYAGGRPVLGIRMSTDYPEPRMGEPGSVVKFKATGLLPYKNTLRFLLNGEPAEVVGIDSTGIQVKVPESASTGVGAVAVDDRIVFGPVFRVTGKLQLDNSFKATVGADRVITDVLVLADGRMIMVGDFTDYERKGTVKPINRILMTTKDGDLDRSLLTDGGSPGYISSIASLPNGKMVIGGGFSSYNIHLGEISNITVLNSNGTIDSMVVRTFTNQDTVPAFNGGVDGSIRKVFTNGNSITAIGGFNFYLQRVYGYGDYRGKYDSLAIDSVRIKNLVRFFPDGSLDSSFNYNLALHKSFDGPNGPINDGFMQEDGKLILVGRFTKYNNEAANNIVRLNADGSIDRTFKSGNGSDLDISSITYNKFTHRFTLAGNFTTFDGVEQNGLALLKEDGSLDQAFKGSTKENTDVYEFAAQLSNGWMIVSGNFRNYGGVHRGNFMVLDQKGALLKGYNTNGDLGGVVRHIYETKNFAGQIQVLLTGGFDKFDEQPAGNVTRILLK
ncbi:hypothetical protein CTE07_48370 [Chitinophaga terrae (ex Kim and Jung 2007)]|nr:hypothetical protein CTE07_48370 [Chitinophaga terrae (ex Kim and Jung 2007)]